MSGPTVELLYWSGCPSHPRALQDLREALAENGLDPQSVTVREVSTDGDAHQEGFVGSPTIRLDGVDIQPPRDEPTGLTCRIYKRRDGRISPTPDPQDVRDAIREAMNAARTGEGAGGTGTGADGTGMGGTGTGADGTGMGGTGTRAGGGGRRRGG
jgi:hypothetical protein